jgi:hypothetical protein
LIVVDPVSFLDSGQSEHSPARSCKHISVTGTEGSAALFLHKQNRILKGQNCFAAQAIEELFGELLHAD